jgi:hypothetical protein
MARFSYCPAYEPISSIRLAIVRCARCFLIAAFLAFVCAASAFSQATNYDDRELQLRQDTPWIVFLDMRIIDQYLNYPGSDFASPTRIRVSYWLRQGVDDLNNDPDNPSYKLYEDIWLKNGRAIGLHRYSRTMPLRYDGSIFVRPYGRMGERPADVASAIVRVLMDVTLIYPNPPLRGVSLPIDVFDQVANELRTYNFERVQSFGGRRSLLFLHLISDPPRPDHDKFYFLNVQQ